MMALSIDYIDDGGEGQSGKANYTVTQELLELYNTTLREVRTENQSYQTTALFSKQELNCIT